MLRKLSGTFAILAVLIYSVAQANTALPDVIERVKPSVVVVGTFSTLRSPQFTMKGTGFVVAGGNLAVTNAHVVGEAPESDNAVIALLINPGSAGAPQLRRAERVATDKAHDLALLKFEGSPVPAFPMADSPAVREGQTIAFMGFPIGGALGFSPVTHRGMVASITSISNPAPAANALNEKNILSLRRGNFNIYQLDATAYPGNSGSPLFDPETGELLGIINMVFVKSTKESMLSQPSGISYAVPVLYLQQLLGSLGGQ